jgi:glycosyltransferase involved in cell wall biosynthesis
MITVITPTWQRHELLTDRCIPSVLAQENCPEPVQHVVVSDGPDPELRYLLAGHYPHVSYAELNEHDPGIRWGVRARLRGLELARGDLIAWLDDDNAYRPMHLAVTSAALRDHPGTGFAYTWAQFHGPAGQWLVGSDPPVYGGIDTSVLVHRKELTDQIATWRDDGPHQVTIDWDLVERWLAAGITWTAIPSTTIDYYLGNCR